MKILQVIDQLNVGGAERVLVDLSNILVEYGLQVSVMTLVRPGKLREQLAPSISLTNLNRINKFNVFKLYECHQICTQYDIIHVHLRYNFRYVALSKWLFGGQYKILLHDHFGDIENDRSLPSGLRWLLKQNYWFAGVSQPLVDWAIEHVNLKKDFVFLLPNIVLKRNNTKGDIHQSSIVKMIHVSNFREAKNHSFAVKLISELRKHFQLQVHFIGQVIDQSFLNSIEQQIKEAKLGETISIDHNCHDIQSLLNEFDIALHTAYQESGPLVLIEYLAHKLPFLAYKTGEVASQVDKFLPEFFIDNFVIAQWVERINRILRSRNNFVHPMDEAFNLLFSPEAYFNKCISIYNIMILNNRE